MAIKWFFAVENMGGVSTMCYWLTAHVTVIRTGPTCTVSTPASEDTVTISTPMNWFCTVGNMGGVSTTFTGKWYMSLLYVQVLHALLRHLPSQATVVSFMVDFEAALWVVPLQVTFVHLQTALVSEHHLQRRQRKACKTTQGRLHCLHSLVQSKYKAEDLSSTSKLLCAATRMHAPVGK